MLADAQTFLHNPTRKSPLRHREWSQPCHSKPVASHRDEIARAPKPTAFASGVDLQDVKHLIKPAKSTSPTENSPKSPSVMPQTPYEPDSSGNSAKNRVRESP